MSAPVESVTFSVNGVSHTVANPEPYATLNSYLRSQPGLGGTKHNCGAAGCGVCAVVLTFAHPVSGATVSVPVNSCVRPLLACQGQTITTVEGIGGGPLPMHPVQQRLADNNGSQVITNSRGHWRYHNSNVLSS